MYVFPQAGQHFYAYITAISAGPPRIFTLDRPFPFAYSVGVGRVAFVIRVPHFRNLFVDTGGKLQSAALNPPSFGGGFMVLRAHNFTLLGSIDNLGKGQGGGGVRTSYEGGERCGNML